MSKTTNKFLPEVRQRAIRMVLDHEAEHPSRWASRELLQSHDPASREAIDLFVFRITGETARISATLGGLDTLIFSAGIGENQPEIKTRISSRLAWLGMELNPGANLQSTFEISSPASRIRVFVIPTDEEQVIAEQACHVSAISSS